MKRRTFIQSAAMASLSIPGSGMITKICAAEKNAASSSNRGSFAAEDNRVRFFTPTVSSPLRVLIVADTHLFTDDDRGEPYRQFSGRMAKAYNQTKHFQTGAPTNPKQSFTEILKLGQESQIDLLALVGDIFSFPSEAAIDWVND